MLRLSDGVSSAILIICASAGPAYPFSNTREMRLAACHDSYLRMSSGFLSPLLRHSFLISSAVSGRVNMAYVYRKLMPSRWCVRDE